MTLGLGQQVGLLPDSGFSHIAYESSSYIAIYTVQLETLHCSPLLLIPSSPLPYNQITIYDVTCDGEHVRSMGVLGQWWVG